MGHKVLLADDSITVQKIVKLSLTEEGIEVIAVGNGEQAVQQLETLRPDLVMADVFMPGKDGYEVCEFVKSHPQLKPIPVILLVHAFEPFDPDRAKKAGADHQLTKPFQSIRTLVTTVKDLLESSTVAEPIIQIPEPMKAVSAATTAVVMPISFQPDNRQLEEESAVVSSLPSPFPTAELGPSQDAVAMSGLTATLTPTVLTPAAPFLMPEATLPVPLTDPSGLPKSDLLPPSELSVLSTTEWQPNLSSKPEYQLLTPTLADSSKTETTASSFQPLSLATSFVSENGSTDDVLELSDIFSDSMGVSLTPAAPQVHHFASDVPLLAVLGNSPVVTEETLSPLTLEEPSHSTFASSFDVATGQVSLETAPLPLTTTSTVQDINVGSVTLPAATAALPIPESVIEEIVNRVIQRLSSNAIQEIAWEVVPEMAELLIRKQISQQKHFTH